MLAGPEHLVTVQFAGPPVHPLAHVPPRVERGSGEIPQSAPSGGAEPEREGAVAKPTVTSWAPRPPGAAGPGRPVSGRAGPGRPGPGQLASPRW
jgi:hypothetical protein